MEQISDYVTPKGEKRLVTYMNSVIDMLVSLNESVAGLEKRQDELDVLGGVELSKEIEAKERQIGMLEHRIEVLRGELDKERALRTDALMGTSLGNGVIVTAGGDAHWVFRGNPIKLPTERVLALLNGGDKFAAVKLYRASTGVGLAEAKYIIESFPMTAEAAIAKAQEINR